MKFTEAIQNKFIVYSLLSFLLYFILSGTFPPNSTNTIYISFLNLINAIGGLLLITGLYDVVLKEQFQNETIENFVKTLYLDNNYIGKFKEDELKSIMLKLENKILKNNHNNFYKDRIINLINNQLLLMGSGTHKEEILNTFFQNYDEHIIYSKSTDQKTIKCKVFTSYKLINNTSSPINQTIFTKKSIDSSIFALESEPLKLKKLELIIDGKRQTQYDDSTKLSNYFKLSNNSSTSVSNRSPRRLQLKEITTKDGKEELIEFERKFNKSIIVKKELEVTIPYNDVSYAHVFHRPIINYSLTFRDYNAIKVEGLLLSAFHKSSDDTIHVNTPEANEFNLNLKDDLLLPKEGLFVMSIRN